MDLLDRYPGYNEALATPRLLTAGPQRRSVCGRRRWLSTNTPPRRAASRFAPRRQPCPRRRRGRPVNGGSRRPARIQACRKKDQQQQPRALADRHGVLGNNNVFHRRARWPPSNFSGLPFPPAAASTRIRPMVAGKPFLYQRHPVSKRPYMNIYANLRKHMFIK
jgi:hypothetical protein